MCAFIVLFMLLMYSMCSFSTLILLVGSFDRNLYCVGGDVKPCSIN